MQESIPKSREFSTIKINASIEGFMPKGTLIGSFYNRSRNFKVRHFEV